jgi:hypothetical protein
LLLIRVALPIKVQSIFTILPATISVQRLRLV